MMCLLVWHSKLQPRKLMLKSLVRYRNYVPMPESLNASWSTYWITLSNFLPQITNPRSRFALKLSTEASAFGLTITGLELTRSITSASLGLLRRFIPRELSKARASAWLSSNREWNEWAARQE